VRNYTKPVNKIKLVIKAVHRGTQYRDTCISLVKLRAALAQKPEIHPASNALPIYIEDNHAGTFYWLAQHVDLDQPCTLVHFDAHSDASGIFDSDNIRDALRYGLLFRPSSARMVRVGGL
jgi:hypothetical protein